MLIDMTFVLRGLDGQPLLRGEDPLVLRLVCCDALTGDIPFNATAKGPEKFQRYVLAQKIYTEDSPDLSPEDLTLLKAAIGNGFGPMVVGPAFVALDGAAHLKGGNGGGKPRLVE